MQDSVLQCSQVRDALEQCRTEKEPQKCEECPPAEITTVDCQVLPDDSIQTQTDEITCTPCPVCLNQAVKKDIFKVLSHLDKFIIAINNGNSQIAGLETSDHLARTIFLD